MTPSSASSAIRSFFDTNNDGTISATEVSGNPLIKLFIGGDVDVDSDGIYELSLAVGFDVVDCTIVI
jgi:hypothetical protein